MYELNPRLVDDLMFMLKEHPFTSTRELKREVDDMMDEIAYVLFQDYEKKR